MECSICYGETDDTVLKTKCNHIFHRECIKEWMREISNKWKLIVSIPSSKRCAPFCPYCRKRIDYLALLQGEIKESGVHVSLYQVQQEQRIAAEKHKIANKNISKGLVVAKHCTKNKYIKSKPKMKAKPRKKCAATTRKGTICKNSRNPKYGKYCGIHINLYKTEIANLETLTN